MACGVGVGAEKTGVSTTGGTGVEVTTTAVGVVRTADPVATGVIEETSALSKGVGALAGQRAGDGVHTPLECGLTLLARRKFKIKERALSQSGPFSNTA